ncbi:MAG: histidine--tRNA ligase [Spirosomataceae bacterium]
MTSKPSLPRGTRDFGPETMAKRNYIFQHIRTVFQKYGFSPIETPTMENLSVLMGKYGEEGDQLLFKILNSGNFLSTVDPLDYAGGAKKILPKIAEKGLRYDLTVPFARFVAMHRNDIAMPFKRYQIQPVWRADRPQKGRYREFYQCDADVVGTNSLLCEAEIVCMLHEIFEKLALPDFVIKINNRKILSGIAEVIGKPGKEAQLCVAIDKLDKIGQEKVEEELIEKGFETEHLQKLQPIFTTTADGFSFESLRAWLASSEVGMKGIEELETIWNTVARLGLQAPKIQLDVTLARGLSYYTGAIFEVKAIGVQMGSISGGGRYDNLTGTFGLPDVSGVGISLGVDRIYDVMEELNLFPASALHATEVLLTHFDEQSYQAALPLLMQLRNASISAELYPDIVKLKKQLDYANKKQIPFVIVIGSEEIETGLYTLKNMETGEQFKASIAEIIEKINAKRI